MAGDYFQVLRDIIAPAALMVRQESKKNNLKPIFGNSTSC